MSAKMRQRCLSLTVVAILTAVTGCTAAERWENLNIDRNLWASDTTACRRFASDRTSLEERQANSYDTGRLTSSDSLQAQMNQVTIARRQRELFKSCMDAQGYRKVTE